MIRHVVFLVSFFFVGLFSEGVLAECPSEHDIPVMFNSTHYLGCYYYDGGNAESAIQACNTEPYGYYEGFEQTAQSGYHFDNHALVVRPGCMVYEFSEIDYQGSVSEYLAGIHPNVPTSKGIKVRCDIDHIDCQPSDEYAMVLVCDALDAVGESECTYTKTIGTSYTESISESMSLDTGLAEEMQVGFFGLFSTTLGVSVNTGYDWTNVSESTQGVQESFEVSAIAPAGTVVTIEQALGQCGGSDVNTELFRITQKSQDGETTVKYVKAASDEDNRV